MILIVDDEKDVSTALQRLLRHAGQEAESVNGGAEAFYAMHRRKPALMVLDVNMPVVDGLTVLRTIRSCDEWNDVRVLMYSADSERGHEAMRLGAADFLVKGAVTFDHLIARICELAGAPPH
jgi:DNA-binding response OmpR family regulator